MSETPALRVLLTRPRHDAELSALELARHNIEAVLAPLIEISDVADPDRALKENLPGVQAVLVTSANGVRAFARATADRDLPIFAVGDASAEAARQAGFAKVSSAQGDVATLAALVRDRLDPNDGPLLHAAGSAVAGDLSGDLTGDGFTVRRVQLYQALPVAVLPDVARCALVDGAIDVVLLYSPRTAARFVSLVVAAGLEQHCAQIIAGCLSPAVAEAAAGLSFAEIRTAATPSQAALAQVLTRAN